ncbi:hypothetical protein PPL_01173 [Heterostelium album PN500]|uniref:Uncharacterized protein n=1 Tax=Heterostelium pallidum (strain ATCC 26659 / Pp 5 / PN500) TaxID=670386 RepID=D3AYB3_HETP5|nr:hypothetical protein PPL_01173 [Heterostelium album PN500]EFA85940.1 hypothetical protein PPL_01173 [Heterostelium album PN500]|eukprot:XP_020438046.1 hypothetical protein PPL_01173 [Heterostelium album PN500]
MQKLMRIITSIILIFAFVALVAADSVTLCGVCSGSGLLQCGSGGSKKCVNVPVGRCYNFNDICTGLPMPYTYYISSIDTGYALGSVYTSMSDCSSQINASPLAESCGDCQQGTTLTCNDGNGSYSLASFEQIVFDKKKFKYLTSENVPKYTFNSIRCDFNKILGSLDARIQIIFMEVESFGLIITSIILIFAFVALAAADSVTLCGVCSGSGLLQCGSGGSKKCVNVPLGTLISKNICTGQPMPYTYFIRSIDTGVALGYVYHSMASCSSNINASPLAETCGDCQKGTTLTCNEVYLPIFWSQIRLECLNISPSFDDHYWLRMLADQTTVSVENMSHLYILPHINETCFLIHAEFPHG